MEKFRKFADHATGINPFVNPAGVGNKPIMAKLKTMVILISFSNIIENIFF